MYAIPKMSRRERQTLRLLLIGKSEKEIGSLLQISPHTVHHYVRAIYVAFAVTTRSELLAKWLIWTLKDADTANMARELLDEGEVRVLATT